MCYVVYLILIRYITSETCLEYADFRKFIVNNDTTLSNVNTTLLAGTSMLEQQQNHSINHRNQNVIPIQTANAPRFRKSTRIILLINPLQKHMLKNGGKVMCIMDCLRKLESRTFVQSFTK